MSEWCSCNKLKEAQREIMRTENALYEACKGVADLFGDCPKSQFDYEFNYCETSCSNETDVATCWMDYFYDAMGRRNA